MIQAKKSELSSGILRPVPIEWENFTSLTKIRSGGEIKAFEAYPYQKILVRLMYQYNSIVVLKSRQMGTTQAIMSVFLHDACVNPAASSILFMRNGEDASAISRRARQMINSIPEYVTSENDNVGYLKVKNGGDLYFKNSGREGSRSLDSATGMLFDECAFIENIQQIYSASSPSSALSADKIKKIIVSTPSAKSGFYWDKINENNGDINIEELAIQVGRGELFKEIPGLYWFVDKVGCCKLIIHYLAHPVYSKIPNYLQYRLNQDGTDEETVEREYNLKFVDSAVSVFNADLVRQNAIGISELSSENKEYYCGLDTSTIGTDYTVFTVLKWEKDKCSLVHCYRKRQQTSEYHIYQISEIIQDYKPKKIGIEITGGVGQLYLEQLVIMHPDTEFVAIKTTSDTKSLMISGLILALEKNQIEYPSNSPLIAEMLSFRRIGNKLEAANKAYDDTVMSTAFALQVSPFRNKEINPWTI